MKRRIALGIAGAAAAIAMLVPVAGNAAPKTCVIVTGPGGFHVQVGYSPNGPQDCRVLP